MAKSYTNMRSYNEADNKLIWHAPMYINNTTTGHP